MFTNKEVVFGTITACDPDNTLTVQLENGETGRVTASETGRREIKPGMTLAGLVGRRHGFYAGETDETGCRILSAKAYENDLYEDIVRRFETKERNVYTARLASTTKDGRYAFYALAQGVNGAVHVSDFALTRIPSFSGVEMPRTLTVAIKQIDGLGRIQLSAKPAFGDFAASVRKLGIHEGSVIDGFVSGHVQSNNDAVVTLAPNLAILTSHASLGQWVKVQITRVSMAEQRLKGQLAEISGASVKPFHYSDWNTPAEELPAYVDVAEFEQRIGPRSRAATPPPAPQLPAELSYETTATSSPYALRPGETCTRAPLHNGNRNRVIFEAQQGYLNTNHMLVAQCVNELKYTTTWQLQRYIHLKHGVMLAESTLQNVLSRLTKLDILHYLHFSLDGHVSAQHIYYPGAALYQSYTGQRRNLPDAAYTTDPDPTRIKWQLSANQLLIGMMHTHSGFQEASSHVFLTREDGRRVHPIHKIVTAGGDVYYLESARSNWTNELLDKLKRYDVFLTSIGEKAKVVVTLEDDDAVDACIGQVIGLHLSIPVLVTCDLHCLPTVVAHEIPAWTPIDAAQAPVSPQSNAKVGFFSRIRGLFQARHQA